MHEDEGREFEKKFRLLVEKLVPALEQIVGQAKIQKSFYVGRYCDSVDAEELCKFLANQLVPALEKLFTDHARLHAAIVQMSVLLKDEFDAANMTPVLLPPEGENEDPDPNSPPSGPPPFPPELV